MSKTNDISIDKFSLVFQKKELIINGSIKIAFGKRYGLIGKNGSGKSTLLKAITSGNFYSEQIDISMYNILYVEQEIESFSEKSVYDCVIEANSKIFNIVTELKLLEKQLDVTQNNDELLDKFNILQDELDKFDFIKQDSIVRKILFGLGFDKSMQDKMTNDFSGGWRMRIAIAKALYITPDFLFLDEPTNHLDLETVIWLQEYIKKYKKTIVVISHNQGFINDVCTDILRIDDDYKKVSHYIGNYYYFLKMHDQEINKMEKEWDVFQKKIRELQNKSTPKTQVDDFIKKNPVRKPPKPYNVKIKLHDIDYVKGDLIKLENVSFSYPEKDNLFEELSLAVDIDSRITIVGLNGSGKSTLMKLLNDELKPSCGEILRNSKLQIGYFNQHSHEKLPLDKTPIEYLQSLNSDLSYFECCKYMGMIGINDCIKIIINDISGGQKARLSLLEFYITKPNLLLLDEPTNHLDIETIKSLIDAINDFSGAVIIISHDIDLINNTHCKIYELEEGYITETTYNDYVDKIIDLRNL
jgi:ATP-binding cassette subfamily F protein 1